MITKLAVRSECPNVVEEKLEIAVESDKKMDILAPVRA
jgi:hypothetical protein